MNIMNKVIVLHDSLTNDPIVVRASAIKAVRKVFDRAENVAKEYSEIMIDSYFIGVKETIGTVMTKINKVESEAQDADSN